MSNGELTLDVLRQAIDAARVPLYYGLSDAVERGTVLHYQAPVPPVGFSSRTVPAIVHTACEWILLHPDDLPGLQDRLAGRRLVPLSGAL